MPSAKKAPARRPKSASRPAAKSAAKSASSARKPRVAPIPESSGKSGKSPSKLLLAGFVFAGGVLLALGILSGMIDGYGQKNRTQKADAIVVLGAGVRPDGSAGQGLQRRVLHAVRLYKKGFAPKIIMTGGVGTHPPAEAEVAAQLAIQHGVPRGDIIREDKSTSTWENAFNAAQICKKRGWKNVIVASDPFHLWRAQRNFARCWMRTFASPVAVEMWKNQPLMKAFWTARESVLVARDWCLRRV